jgi:hypothetical protein
MIEHGLIIAGELVPNTSWIRRDPAHWFESGRGTRRRDERVDLLVGHWTGGEAGLFDPDGRRGPLEQYDDDGPFIVRVMRDRKRADGTPMNVGIAFVIGACHELAEEAPVWQTADPGKVATVHLGTGHLNARSIGVEVVSAGMPGPTDRRSRPRTKVPLVGKMREVLRFYPGQLRAWLRLAETLASLDGRAGISIPRRVPAFGASRRLSRAESRRWAGATEHLHMPATQKLDAGGMLVDALANVGWERAQP